MSEFPKKLLFLAFTSVASVLWGIFYMFGIPREMSVGGFFLYLAMQVIWIVPIILFFVSLNEYRRGYPRRAYVYASIGALLSVLSLVLLFVLNK